MTTLERPSLVPLIHARGQHLAEAIPLLLGQDAPHLHEHQNLALEKPPSCGAQSRRRLLNGWTIQSTLVEVSSEVDASLFDFAAKVDQVTRITPENAIEIRTLLRAECEPPHDFLSIPPFPGRQAFGWLSKEW
ncbi:MAG TPA: hypothetical protein VMT00_14550 [Thermoanaerobaculia bacterium]|nr:hypothetical protein [Thermoanaerobaculia bacterium]